MTESFHLNQRLSYDGALCTVRYIGPVGATKGEWLGVEWDDVLRGKHSGEHEGKKYFECLIANAGSFIRPTKKLDPSFSFIEGLRRKYTTVGDKKGDEIVYLTANKVFEEVGFDKILQRLSQLQELTVILLDGLQIDRVDDVSVIRETCPNIEELDLSRNRFEKLEDIALVCSVLPKLKSLRISGNRFSSLSVRSPDGFAPITTLEISNMLLPWPELTTLLSLFPNVTTLIAPHNNISTVPSPPPFPTPLAALDLSYNHLSTLSSLSPLSELQNLKTLIISHNGISTLFSIPFPALARLDLAYNALPSFQLLDDLPAAAPLLTSLRISHNPLYADTTIDEAHMLTIARLPPTVMILNHSTITPKERENAEMWYLSRVAKELLSTPDRQAVLRTHRRWNELCNLHGDPAVAEGGGESEKWLAAKVVEMEFVYGEKRQRRRMPRGTPVSTVRGMVGRWFGLRPLGVRLVFVQGQETVELGEVDDTKELGMHVEAGKRLVLMRVEEV